MKKVLQILKNTGLGVCLVVVYYTLLDEVFQVDSNSSFLPAIAATILTMFHYQNVTKGREHEA